MKKLIYLAGLLLFTATAFGGENDRCFSVSFDGNKISHTVVYEPDWDNQIAGEPPPTINVRVFNYMKTDMILGSVISQNVLSQWVGKRELSVSNRYPVSHKIVFSESDLQGKKTSYEIKLEGLGQDMGGGIVINRGQSEVKIDGKVIQFPNLKTIETCPDPIDLNGIKEIESQL
jgi:hypothetical protein